MISTTLRHPRPVPWDDLEVEEIKVGPKTQAQDERFPSMILLKFGKKMMRKIGATLLRQPLAGSSARLGMTQPKQRTSYQDRRGLDGPAHEDLPPIGLAESDVAVENLRLG